ncbi:MAG TPA: histidine phosphatase family protein [Rugosimonospora sp.]|jgi:broad specificity phosphatase PhoE
MTELDRAHGAQPHGAQPHGAQPHGVQADGAGAHGVQADGAPGELAELIVVRHGESVANAAFAAANAAGRASAGISGPDSDVPLTDLGRRQAAALGHWLGALPADRFPEVALCSPYLRARHTLELAASAAERDNPRARVRLSRVDDRLRDRVMGELQMLTRMQIAERFPAEAERRRTVDEYVYRPPGGESFGDVADRLASLLTDVRREHAGRRVLVVAHDAVVLMLRRLVEGLSWDEVRAIARDGLADNASVTRWTGVDDALVLAEYNVTAHLR